MGLHLSETELLAFLACVTGGMQEQASGGRATIFHHGQSPRGIHEWQSGE